MNENLENNNLISKWLVGDLSEEERVELEQEEKLDDLKFVVEDIASWSLKPLDIEGGLTKLKERRTTSPAQGKVVKFNTWMRVAAAVSLIILSYFSWDFYFNTQMEITTGIAEVQDINLPDESLVKLDAGSSVSYNKKTWQENRELSLQGQAYFDVVKGGSFVVNTSSGSVSVLGTQFNVRSEGDLFRVACYEGSVMVKSGQEEEILKPGDAVTLINGTLTRIAHDKRSPNWMQGFSEYDRALLSQVVEDLKKYYLMELTLPAKYEQLEFTGKVTHSNREQALKTIFSTMEIKYSIDGADRVVFE